MHIHERIKDERVKSGLTPEQVAEKIGVARTTYLYWEEKTPNLDKIKKVSKALGLPDNYFLTETDENTDNTKKAGQKANENYVLSSANVNVTLQDYIDLLTKTNKDLAQTNEKLVGIINSALLQIRTDQQYTLAYLKAGVEHQAEMEAQGDPRKQEELVYKMGKLVDGKIQDAESMGTRAESGT